jgi:hypothetical protein
MGTDKILERKPHVTHLLKTPKTTTTHNMTPWVKWVLPQNFVRQRICFSQAKKIMFS